MIPGEVAEHGGPTRARREAPRHASPHRGPAEAALPTAQRIIQPGAARTVPPGALRAGLPALQRSAGNGAAGLLVARAPAATFSEAKADQLARFPGRALSAWRTLTESQRGLVFWKMAARYGLDFAALFLPYASGASKPNISNTVSNSPKDSPRTLTARGYRRAGDQGGTEVWVHPSGHEIWLLARSAPGPEPEPEPDTEPDPACSSDCLNSSDDGDACHECCDDSIPDTDGPCRKACHASCENKL